MTKKYIGIALAAVLFVLGLFLEIPGLSHEGTIALFTMLAGVALWLFESIPFAITGLLLMLLLILSGAGTSKALIGGFMSESLVFLIFCFTFGTILNQTSFAPRIASGLLGIAKGKPRRLIFWYLMAACTTSMFMHNMAAIAIFMPIGIKILETLGQEKITSNLGKCMMLGLALAAMTGGAATPMGNPMNVLCLNLVQATADVTIPFGVWCVIGVPLAWIITASIFFALTLFYKPEEISEEKYSLIVDQFKNPAPITSRDWLALLTLIVCIALLVAGTWIKIFSLFNVAIVALVFMTLPGINLITWKGIVESVNWEAFLMFGSVSAIVTVLVSTGTAAWIASILTNLVGGMPIIVVVMILLLTCHILDFTCPFGPGLASILIPTFCGVAAAIGFSPNVASIICSFALGASYLMPFALPSIITMGSGYFEVRHVPLPGLIPTAVAIILGAVIIYGGLSLFGC